MTSPRYFLYWSSPLRLNGAGFPLWTTLTSDSKPTSHPCCLPSALRSTHSCPTSSHSSLRHTPSRQLAKHFKQRPALSPNNLPRRHARNLNPLTAHLPDQRLLDLQFCSRITLMAKHCKALALRLTLEPLRALLPTLSFLMDHPALKATRLRTHPLLSFLSHRRTHRGPWPTVSCPWQLLPTILTQATTCLPSRGPASSRVAATKAMRW